MNLISKIKKSLLENKEVSIAALAAVSTCVGNMVLGGECKLFAASVIFALIANLFLFIKWTKQEDYTDNGRKVAKFAKFVLVAIAVLFVAFGFYCKATNHKHFLTLQLNVLKMRKSQQLKQLLKNLKLKQKLQ